MSHTPSESFNRVTTLVNCTNLNIRDKNLLRKEIMKVILKSVQGSEERIYAEGDYVRFMQDIIIDEC